MTMPANTTNAPERTWLFRNGVAVRERGGVEVWRRQYAPIAVDAGAEPREGKLAGAERAGVLGSPGASEAAASAQTWRCALPSTAEADDSRNKRQTFAVVTITAQSLQGDLFAEPPAPDHFCDATKMIPPAPVVGEPMPAAPFVRGSQTSHAAAVAIEPSRESQAGRVLEWLRSRADAGGTSDEIEAALGIAHQSCGPRIRELEKAGRIIRTERTRLTASGRAASVLVAAAASSSSSATAQP